MNDEKNNKNTFFADYSNLMLTINKLSKSAENPFFKSGYVPLKDILNEVKRVCLDNNFIFIQRPKVMMTEQMKNVLATELIHKDGKEIKGEIEIISKDPSDPQKVGAGLTYMRRYSLTTMFGIEEEDDDGNLASKKRVKKDNNPIPPAQRTQSNTPPFEEPRYVNPIPPAQRTQSNTPPFEEPRYVKPKKNERIEGQPCSDCSDGKIVKNPKTNKLFCNKKCWLSK